MNTSPQQTTVTDQFSAIRVSQPDTGWVCPSCGSRGRFIYGGEQTLPLRVAMLAGLPASFSLWHCESCRSTFGETELTLCRKCS